MRVAIIIAVVFTYPMSELLCHWKQTVHNMAVFLFCSVSMCFKIVAWLCYTVCKLCFVLELIISFYVFGKARKCFLSVSQQMLASLFGLYMGWRFWARSQIPQTENSHLESFITRTAEYLSYLQDSSLFPSSFPSLSPSFLSLFSFLLSLPFIFSSWEKFSNFIHLPVFHHHFSEVCLFKIELSDRIRLHHVCMIHNDFIFKLAGCWSELDWISFFSENFNIITSCFITLGVISGKPWGGLILCFVGGLFSEISKECY